MARAEFYNSVLDKLVDELDSDGVIKKSDRIICCTNGNSNIASELKKLGYNAEEVQVQRFEGKCDVFICMLRHVDIFKTIEKMSHTTKILSLYRILFSSDDPKETDKIQQFFKRSIGTSEIITIPDEKTGKKWSEPFDNRVFYYDFSGGRN